MLSRFLSKQPSYKITRVFSHFHVFGHRLIDTEQATISFVILFIQAQMHFSIYYFFLLGIIIIINKLQFMEIERLIFPSIQAHVVNR